MNYKGLPSPLSVETFEGLSRPEILDCLGNVDIP